VFTLNRSLLFTNSEFVRFVCLKISKFSYKNRMFFLGKSELVFIDNWSFFCFLPGLCAFIMCKAQLIKNIRPYFIASVPSTLSDVSALVVLRYKS